jgi:serine/threonine protein phosphatase PrpC
MGGCEGCFHPKITYTTAQSELKGEVRAQCASVGARKPDLEGRCSSADVPACRPASPRLPPGGAATTKPRGRASRAARRAAPPSRVAPPPRKPSRAALTSSPPPSLRAQDVLFVSHDRPWPGSEDPTNSGVSDAGAGLAAAGADPADPHGGSGSLRWLSEDHPPACPACGTDTSRYSLFAVFDGHNGAHAARLCGEAVLPVLESRLPLGCPPPRAHPGYPAWADAVLRALVETVVELNRLFAERGVHAGATATVVLVHGALVSCANVGDSRACVDTGGECLPLSSDHRVATHRAERRRVEEMGAQVAPVSMYGAGPANSAAEGVGPLRVWPGGLCLSRAVGDFDVGEAVIPVPFATQVELPPSGGRVALGSDGVWDAFERMARFAALSREWPVEQAPSRLVQTIVRAFGGLKDDTTIAIVDVMPEGGSFVATAVAAKRAARVGGGGAGGANGAAGGGGGGGCCFSAPAVVPGAGAGGGADASVDPNVSVRGGAAAGAAAAALGASSFRAAILHQVDVAALMGLVPGADPAPPAWFDEPLGDALFAACVAAAGLWAAAAASKLSRGGGGRAPAFPATRLVRRRRAAPGTPPEALPASQRFRGAVAEGEGEYEGKFGHYKAAAGRAGSGRGAADPSTRAGRVYNSEQSVRAGAHGAGRADDPSIRVAGSGLDKSVRHRASAPGPASVPLTGLIEGLAPVRVVKPGGGGAEEDTAMVGFGKGKR